ncbi:bifunctional DNA-formamidopyrimidine glycosylase/DNA-(apurinic or apyrimidinic site) lyase [Candidatus Halobeggiatoa sp. HSG11]|nr:bifunctional DNA-formamidopyrimidine glycosylase/DNA-(apurinic or apyrimidinic site) lyase [Candidatus Halobeggiatoa sp. HSG11]
MPELPEVETIKNGIANHLKGQIIKSVLVRKKQLRWQIPDKLTTILPKQSIIDIKRRGKYLLFECDKGHILIHLGMSGNLRVMPSDTELKKHDHVDIIFTNGLCLRYNDPRRFGCILWTEAPILEHKLLVNQGPEPLEENFNGKYLYARAKKRRVVIKNFIMDSHVVVGVGNIYANEALFAARIHPERAAGKITLAEYKRLATIIKKTLKTAIKMGGTTLRDFTDSAGNPGYFKQALQVYGKDGEICGQCGTIIHVKKIGQRATYYCPICQR